MELGQGLPVAEVEVVGGDEVGVAAGRLPDPRHHDPHEADEPTGLLEAPVLPEPCVEVTDGRVEGPRLGDAGGELLGRDVGQVHLLRVPDRPGIALGDGFDAGDTTHVRPTTR